jgi:hypothetical protein
VRVRVLCTEQLSYRSDRYLLVLVTLSACETITNVGLYQPWFATAARVTQVFTCMARVESLTRDTKSQKEASRMEGSRDVTKKSVAGAATAAPPAGGVGSSGATPGAPPRVLARAGSNLAIGVIGPNSTFRVAPAPPLKHGSSNSLVKPSAPAPTAPAPAPASAFAAHHSASVAPAPGLSSHEIAIASHSNPPPSLPAIPAASPYEVASSPATKPSEHPVMAFS